MKPTVSISPETLSIFGRQKGELIGTTQWLEITQEDTNAFGRVSRDMDPLHVNPEAAAEGPFGQPITFGFYTLSLLTYFSHELTQWETMGPGLNYGFNKIRFLEKVPVGSRVRAHFTLIDVEERDSGGLLATMDVLVEIEGKEKPALVAEWLALGLKEN